MPETIHEALKNRILVIDGAMGTQLQERDLKPSDFGGDAFEGCNENLVLTRPDVIESVHLAYLEAGADIIETDTFGATEIVLSEYGLQEKVFEINKAAAEIARKACEKISSGGRMRWAAGSMGPTTRAISVTGGVTFQRIADAFRCQALGLLAGGIDLLLLETAQDTLNLKAAAEGIRKAFIETGAAVPLMISGTIEPTGTMLAGQGVEALYASVSHLEDHLGMISIGLNCATGPEFMADHLRALSGMATCHVSVYPNAGLPDENGLYAESPATLAAKLSRFVEAGWVNIIGGCCGTTPAHIVEIARMVAGRVPRTPERVRRRIISGIEPLFVENDSRPIAVGERTNVIGSRKFKNMIVEGKYEEGSEIARAQVKGGAQVIDVCVANPDRNEAEDMAKLLDFLPKKVRAPFMIDTTDPEVMELAMQRLQGKSVLNSINLEEGEARFARVAPLLHRYGGSVVVGCIDENPVNGMAVTRERKLEIAKRSHDLLVTKYGIRREDIIFDPLVFPVGSGDGKYIGSAVETIEGVRLISEAFPDSATILGISNVSFGLPAAGREVLNAVFLYHCVRAGLIYAIVNTEKLERYASIPEEEKRVAEDLIFWRGDDPVAAFASLYREKKPASCLPSAELPLDERLPLYIIEGRKDGLLQDIEEAISRGNKPLDIINGPLMSGMAEVGRLFNSNQLIVAEVLQSAEAMKAAVASLEPLMEKDASSSRGKILLATVKGDVHDIGKNLVEIILSNNGYNVVNLGIKVGPETIIEAARRENPDMIGLSGLLVKSAHQMSATAADLRDAGISVPLLVGGAALSRNFADTRIAPEYGAPVLYAKDAMNGLELANSISDPTEREKLLGEIAGRQKITASSEKTTVTLTSANPGLSRESKIATDHPKPSWPDFQPHLMTDIPLAAILPYLNRQMLYSKHMGLIGVLEKMLESGDEKAIKLHAAVEELLVEADRDNLLKIRGIYRFFPAASDRDDLVLYDHKELSREIIRFRFPRQAKGDRLCVADFARPGNSGESDNIAMFVVSCGEGIREKAEELKRDGNYLKCHMLQALALELAEAAAEFIHKRIRTVWGILDEPGLSMKDIFNARYQGIRVSFGYPACPDMSDQEKLFRLLEPEKIGVHLTEGFMMDPEASVSALVFHHPEGIYFDVLR